MSARLEGLRGADAENRLVSYARFVVVYGNVCCSSCFCRCILARTGATAPAMKGSWVGEDAKPWKGRGVVLWGAEVRTLSCVLIGHLVFQIATLYI